jgi:hypothetical protein
MHVLAVVLSAFNGVVKRMTVDIWGNMHLALAIV